MLASAHIVFLASCSSGTTDDPTPAAPHVATIEDYVGTWEDSTASIQLTIGTDESSTLTISGSSTSGIAKVASDGSASFGTMAESAFSYSLSGGTETFEYEGATWTRKSGSVGTIVGVWELDTVSATCTLTINSDNTFSYTSLDIKETSRSGTWDSGGTTSFSEKYGLAIDTAANPNTITITIKSSDIVLTKEEE